MVCGRGFDSRRLHQIPEQKTGHGAGFLLSARLDSGTPRSAATDSLCARVGERTGRRIPGSDRTLRGVLPSLIVNGPAFDEGVLDLILIVIPAFGLARTSGAFGASIERTGQRVPGRHAPVPFPHGF